MNSTNLGTKIFCLGVIILISAVLSEAHFDRQIRARPNRYCGTALPDTLGILCENGYNSLKKKSSKFNKIWLFGGLNLLKIVLFQF